MIERFFVGPDALIGPLDGSFRRGISPPAGGELLCPWRLVVAKSTRLRFRLVAKTALVPLLLLFPANPLRWASPGGTREITQNAAGDGSRWALRAHICLSPDPRYGGYLLEQAESFRRAKSERRSKFPPGHWALGVQKLQLLRFHNRAWLCRADMPGSKHGIPHPPPSGAPSPKGEGFQMASPCLPL